MRLFVFLVIVGFANASQYADVCEISRFHPDSVGFIIYALALVSFIISIAYMYAKFSHDVKAETFAKDEAKNLLITVILLAGLLAFFTGSCRIAFEYIGKSPFEAAYYYMNSVLVNNGLSIARQLTYSSLSNQLDATAYLFVGFTPYKGYGLAHRANLRVVSSQKEFLLDLYIPIIASISVQKYLLQMIEFVSVSVLLPFGFVLRILPATREYGNVLIALFFGLYIITPSLYALSAREYAKIMKEPYRVVGHSFEDKMAFGSQSGTASTLYRIASTLPQAIFIPNLILVLLISCISALSKALRAIEV
ncbi:MAG: hypothetical protein N3G80_02740 [Candidatus Micrarchaeota archaeon]|nr:hypothetical protein [Candidatus Micrarchaeota archaeon]